MKINPRNILVSGSLVLCLTSSMSVLRADELSDSVVESQARELSQELSLRQAERIAFQNNWDLLAARSTIDQAAAQKMISKELPNPTFSYSTQKVNIDDRRTATPFGNGFWDRNYDSFFMINQLFEIAGKRSNRQKSAEAGFEEAEARFQDAHRFLEAAVAKVYTDALLADSKAGILLQSATSLRKEAELAGIRLEAGDISRSDEEQIEIAAERFELDAKTAEANAMSLKIALEGLLGIKNPKGHFKLADSLEELVQTIPVLDEPKNGFDRPDLIAAQKVLKKTEADLRLQEALRVPDPTVFLQYEHNPPDQPNTIGLGVSFPLPLFSRNAGNIRSALVARDQATRQVEKTKAQIVSDIGSARLNYQEALGRWKNYRDAVRPKSSRILESVIFAYEKGRVSYLDLLAAQRNDNDVKIAAVQAAADTLEAAAALKAVLSVMEDVEPQSEVKGRP